MIRSKHNDRHKRRGAVVVLVAVMMILFVAMVSFAIDYGYILTMETDLQRAADAAALAAVQDLIPDADGSQDTDAARATVRAYTIDNLESGFRVADADIQMGRFDTTTIYQNVTLLNSGVFDAVRVTLRRDGAVNPRFPLFFAQALGIRTAGVTASATAVLQKPRHLGPGAAVLPFAVPVEEWRRLGSGDTWRIYDDGRIVDNSGNTIPGNWGTLDIGSSANSTADLSWQIENGLDQSHLDHLYEDLRIDDRRYIDTGVEMDLNGDPGISVGVKAAVAAAQGQKRVIPLYNGTNDTGGDTLEYHIVHWGMAIVGKSDFHGNTRYIEITKRWRFDGQLRAVSDLTVPSTIEGAFTSPVLVE